MSHISLVLNTCFISFILTFPFFFPLVTHCAFPTLLPPPLPRALCEQSFPEQRNLSPAGASQIRPFSPKETVLKHTVIFHNSEPGKLAIDNTEKPKPAGTKSQVSYP